MIDLEKPLGNLVAVFIVVSFFVVILSRILKKSVKDTLIEIKSWFDGNE